MLIWAGDKGGGGGGRKRVHRGGGRGRLCTYHYTVTTRYRGGGEVDYVPIATLSPPGTEVGER